MNTCAKCGKEVLLPFTCSYCKKSYCGEHRLPMNHECTNAPRKPPSYISPTAEEPPKLGRCPQCHFAYDEETMIKNEDNIIAFDAETLTFKCRRCGFIFAQHKRTPHDYA